MRESDDDDNDNDMFSVLFSDTASELGKSGPGRQGLGKSGHRLGKSGHRLGKSGHGLSKSLAGWCPWLVCRLTVDSGNMNDRDGLFIGVGTSDNEGDVISMTDKFFSEETRGDMGKTNGRDLPVLCSD
jgi:hypothetical protein